jgi:uncharacterized protein (DUF1684 family)
MPFLTLYFVMRVIALISAIIFSGNIPLIPPPTTTPSTPWITELMAWRAQHAADLQKPDGWLSLAGLEWLEPGDTSMGAAADNNIHISAAGSAHVGILRLQGTTVRLIEPPEGFPSGFLVAGEAAKPRVLPVEPDHDKNAVHLTIGTLNMYVIRRGDRFALRIKDSHSQALQDFHGLKWYEPNAGLRVTAKWLPYNPPKSTTLLTLAGTSYSQPVPGVAEFEISGATYRLEPVVEDSEPARLFFILRDTTSASTTYAACRFLYTILPSHGLTQPGELLLDFNKLENPPCAYTPFATCPLPPDGNRLKIALPAGELRYHSDPAAKP